MKKLLALLLAMVMVLSLVACGGGDSSSTPANNSSSGGSSSAADNSSDGDSASQPDTTPAIDTSEPVTLRIWFDGSVVTPDASEKVMESVNAYLNEKLNVTLEPIWGTWGDFNTATVTALQGGDDVDIYFTCNWSDNEYNKYARDGYWVKLDDMLETYAPDLLEIIPEGIWACAETNGYDGKGVYAVPGLKDTATQNCWDVNGTLLAELGYDVDEVCANGIDFYSDEFEEMLKKAKDYKGGDFYPLIGEPVVFERMVNHSSIITGGLGSTSILSYYYDAEHPSKDLGNTIIAKYTSPEYKKFVERMYYLSQQGYISPRTQNADTSNDYMEANRLEGNYLICSQSYAFGCELDYSKARQIDVRMVPETAPYMDCTSGQGAMMAITSVSKNPERALMFLNLLNSDPELMTMMNYGVEGFTYTKNDDGTITFIDDARATYSPWTNGMGNIRILPPTSEQGVDFWDRFSAYYDSAEALPIGGFIFDPSELDTIGTAIANVREQYSFQLLAGAVDPETALPEFLAKLEEAGYSTYVEEVQRQLNEYLGK